MRASCRHLGIVLLALVAVSCFGKKAKKRKATAPTTTPQPKEAEPEVFTNKQKQALVLGGTGFLGRWVTAHLNDKGYNVTVLNRQEAEFFWVLGFLNQSPGMIKHDVLANPRGYHRKLEESVYKQAYWNVVIDFIGTNRTTVNNTLWGLTKTDLRGQKTKQWGANYYLHISEDTVNWHLKLPDNDKPVNEDGVPFTEAELKEHEEYLNKSEIGAAYAKNGSEKLAGENLIRNFEAVSGVPLKWTILRLPRVFGPHDTRKDVFFDMSEAVSRDDEKIPAKVVEGRARKRGGKTREPSGNLVFVADAMDAIFACIAACEVPSACQEKVHGQVFNIGYDRSFTVKEIHDVIADGISQNVDLTKRLGTYNKKWQKSYIMDEEQESKWPWTDYGAMDTYKAKTILGWQPRPFMEAIIVTLLWRYGAFGASANYRIKDHYNQYVRPDYPAALSTIHKEQAGLDVEEDIGDIEL